MVLVNGDTSLRPASDAFASWNLATNWRMLGFVVRAWAEKDLSRLCSCYANTILQRLEKVDDGTHGLRGVLSLDSVRHELPFSCKIINKLLSQLEN